MRKNISIAMLGLFIGLLIAPGSSIAKVKNSDEVYKDLELFTDVLSVVNSDYVDEVKTKDLVYGALKGMLASLDPHSQFMDPDTYNEIKVETEGKFGGIGIEITIKDDILTVITPIDDTPAWKAGLKPDDKIVKIDGNITRGITLMEAVKKLRGQPGTQVSVTILREGEAKLLDFTITRDIIKMQSIKYKKLIDDKIGYIRIIEFRQNTPQDLKNAVMELEKEGIDSLILDVRNNPGGLLNIAVDVADMFIEPGKIVVSTRGRVKNQNMEFKAHSDKIFEYPLVVMVNGGSASASEILAGAVQDNKRGIVLGKKTFGKGSVQTIIPLKDGSALRLTTGKYFTPNGRSIHGEGIMPDVVVEDQQILAKAEQPKPSEDVFERIENHTEPAASPSKGEVREGRPVGGQEKPKEEEKPYDAQLSRAIDILKGIRVYRSLSQSRE